MFGVIGGGSWATALAKVLTDNGHTIQWWVRNESTILHFRQRLHNPHYLSSVQFVKDTAHLSDNIQEVVAAADDIIVAVPSAYVVDTLNVLSRSAFDDKRVISAVKGILPQNNLLLNEYLATEFNFPIGSYYTVMGPCHAEEIAAEKLSYLTFSGKDADGGQEIAGAFATAYLNTVVNDDVTGVQFAAVLKNIYALGAGIAHGLEYGDNFLSVYIANCAREMGMFLALAGDREHEGGARTRDYTASVYLGDLLVTCYSLYSRNRTFGNMIGKGYSVHAAKLELNMVAEGYTASKCIHAINQGIGAPMPIAEGIYRILWQNQHPRTVFRSIEEKLI